MELEREDPRNARHGAYAVWSVGVIVISAPRALTTREGVIVAAADILVITALTMLSGGPFSLTRLGYFVVPVMVAFLYRPAWTLLATVIAIAAFVVQPLLDIGPDQSAEGSVAALVAVYAGMLAWVGLRVRRHPQRSRDGPRRLSGLRPIASGCSRRR